MDGGGGGGHDPRSADRVFADEIGSPGETGALLAGALGGCLWPTIRNSTSSDVMNGQVPSPIVDDDSAELDSPRGRVPTASTSKPPSLLPPLNPSISRTSLTNANTQTKQAWAGDREREEEKSDQAGTLFHKAT